jgi:hypothetical protein
LSTLMMVQGLDPEPRTLNLELGILKDIA